MIKNYFIVALYTILVENVVFVKFLGVCPLLGITDNKNKTMAMSLAVTFTTTVSSAICWLLNLLLVRFGLEYMQTLVFIFIISVIVQVIELWIKKYMPEISKSLGVYVPLITTNCAILGCIMLGIQKEYNFGLAVFYGAMSGISFMLALVLFSLIRERMELSDNIPNSLKGTPILLVAASILALIFNGFSGITF